jgi:hypothetical protein
MTSQRDERRGGWVDAQRETEPPTSSEIHEMAPSGTRTVEPGSRRGEAGRAATFAAPLRKHFRLLRPEDWAHVEAEAVAELRGAPVVPDDGWVRAAVHAAAVEAERAAWAREARFDDLSLSRWRAGARAQLQALPGKQRAVLLAAGLLEAVTSAREEPISTDGLVGVAHALREDTVRQRLSRAWRSVAPPAGADPALFRRRVALRQILPAPELRVWRGAEAFVEGVLQDAQFADLSAQYAVHRSIVGALRSAEGQVARAWALFVERLASSARRPDDVADALVLRCAALGIDDRVPRRGPLPGWSEMLEGAYRAGLGAPLAWRDFLAHAAFEPEVREAFAAVLQAAQRASLLERLAEEEWRRVETAARDIGAFCRLRAEFLDLVASLLV